jgi:hypothetical protein
MKPRRGRAHEEDGTRLEASTQGGGIMNERPSMVWLAAVLIAAGSTALEWAAHARPTHAGVLRAGSHSGKAEVLVRSGSWRGRSGEGRWRARLEHERGNGTLTGEITVDGSRLLRSARVEARVRGASVRGTLKDGDGRWLVRLEATISGDSISGRFEARDGERGTWNSP